MLMNELNCIYLTALAIPAAIAARLRSVRKQRGSVTTEQAIITAAIAVLALGAVAIISSLVMAKINSIDLNNTPPPATPGP